MTFRTRRVVTWATVVSCVALAGCSGGCLGNRSTPDAGGPQGPLALLEQEPNDRPDQAQRLSQDTDVSGTLGADPSRPDSDVFVLGSPQPRMADVSVSGIPGVNVTLEVIDRDRNVLLLANGGGDGAGERLPNLKVQGDTFVRIAATKKGAGGAYALKVHFSEPPQGLEMEPNERAVDSTPLGVLPTDEPLRVSGLIGHPTDEDWYRVDLVATAAPPVPSTPAAVPPPATAVDASTEASLPPTHDGGETAAVPETGDAAPNADAGTAPLDDEPRTALRIEVTPVPGVRLEVSVLSTAEAPLFTTKSKEGEGLMLRNVGVRAADASVYVVVKSGWGGTGKEAKRGANPDAPYTLTVTREVAGATAEYEPNDELTKATPLERGSYREGFLSPKGDTDYYVVRAEAPGLTQLQLTGVERLDLMLSVVQPAADGGTAETSLLISNDGALKEPEVLNNVQCAPECFVKVQGAMRKVDGQNVRDYENAEQGYRLSANPVAEGSGELEPNNTADQANTLVLGKPVRGTVHPKKDVDQYKLDLSERPVKTPLTATVTGILKVDVGLYLYALDDEGKAELVQTADRAKGDAPETIRFTADPGVYLFVVKDSKNRESNFQDSYQLTVIEGE